MAAEDVDRLVRICQDFVRSMYRTEEAVVGLDDGLTKEEMEEGLTQVLSWLQETEELPANCFTREIAREIIGQLSGAVALRDYRGSADSYIA